jgi:hypothetical protein
MVHGMFSGLGVGYSPLAAGGALRRVAPVCSQSATPAIPLHHIQRPGSAPSENFRIRVRCSGTALRAAALSPKTYRCASSRTLIRD